MTNKENAKDYIQMITENPYASVSHKLEELDDIKDYLETEYKLLIKQRNDQTINS